MAMERGAIELDMVINYGQFLAGRATLVRRELKDIVRTAHKGGVKVKVILETCYYDPAQIHDACDLCLQYDVDWVKTSTGFGSGGASMAAVQVMLDVCGGRCQVKASGGITDPLVYLNLGCTRLGMGLKSFEALQ